LYASNPATFNSREAWACTPLLKPSDTNIKIVCSNLTTQLPTPRGPNTVENQSIRDRYLEGEVSFHGLQVARGRLESRLHQVLNMTLTHGGNKKLAKHVGRHQDEILTFLKYPNEIEATNCDAEQETRPAVLARKISGCNKSWAGAHAHEILVTWLRTAFHAGESGIAWLIAVLRHHGPDGPPLPALLDSG
jgi:hypothetical protein